MGKNPSDESPYYILTEKRDLLDIFDSYKYMNSPLIAELFTETYWDHGYGWIQLNYSPHDWRHRHVLKKNSPFPEASSY